MSVVMPKCPKCGKPMFAKETLNLNFAIQKAISTALRAACDMPPPKPEFACKNNKQHNEIALLVWEKKNKKQVDELKSKLGDKCAKHVEKNGYNGTYGELEKMFGGTGMLSKLKGALPNKNRNKKYNIEKKPPEFVPCVNHWRLTTKPIYRYQTTKRKIQLFFVYNDMGMLVKKANFIEKLLGK